MKLTVAPLTPDRWPDLEAVFNAKGCSVARGCWCMAYRLSGSRGPLPPGMTRAQANRAALKALVDAGNPPGLIGYRGKVPVGWVSIGPREEYAKLKRSPVMKAVDEQPVWSVVCFVVPTEYRGQGVARALLKGAVAYAKEQGARWSRPTPSTNLLVPTTTPCGSGRSPCTTKPASRKWRVASRSGLSSASSLSESPMSQAPNNALHRTPEPRVARGFPRSLRTDEREL